MKLGKMKKIVYFHPERQVKLGDIKRIYERRPISDYLLGEV